MLPKIKNALIFISIALVLILAYFFFVKKSPEEVNLISSLPTQGVQIPAQEKSSRLSEDFLPLLLSVKNIKLDDSIFSDPAFIILADSSIFLTPDGNEGRLNPFAPLGYDEDLAPPLKTSPEGVAN